MVPPQVNGTPQQRKYYRIVVKHLRSYRQNWAQILALLLASYVILVKIMLTSLSLSSGSPPCSSKVTVKYKECESWIEYVPTNSPRTYF